MGKKSKDSKGSENGSVAPETDEKYPYYVFFILGNEFCERYAYYGMRSILVIYLKYFLGFTDDYATIIYHTFAALCYFFPLPGGIIADSYWGKANTILRLSFVYLIGMVLMAVAALPQIGGSEDGETPGLTNEIITYIALFTVAVGTGGIKPCVSALGGDQFPDTELGRERVSSFFSLFYASINAGSLLSTFISPILREKVKCFDRDDCYFVAFVVPACLMAVAIMAFIFGRSYYIDRKPTGNVFVEFCSASWAGIKEKCCGKQEKQPHFLDYAIAKGHAPEIVRDGKYVFPIIIMFTPLPFFWALFDMQGSRWTLSATQMNGWQGGDAFKVLPDQVQIMNPIMILLFLPLFQKIIYPAFEWCGIKVTSLRRMSMGMVFAALAFVVSGFVQFGIEDDLTPIPDSGDENSLMILNGIYGETLNIESEYWSEVDYDSVCKDSDGVATGNCFDNGEKATSFELKDDEWRTKTFAWVRDTLPYQGGTQTSLRVCYKDDGCDRYQLTNAKSTVSRNQRYKKYRKSQNHQNFKFSSEMSDSDAIGIHSEVITGAVFFKNETTGLTEHMEYESPSYKSDTLRVKAVLVNPTKYWVYPRLKKWNYKNKKVEINPTEFSGNDNSNSSPDKFKYRTVPSPYSVETNDAEFDQGIFSIEMVLFKEGSDDIYDRELEDEVARCSTPFIWRNGKDGEILSGTEEDLMKVNFNSDDFAFLPGAIWTSMVRTYESNGKIECEVVYGQDSNSNKLNIFWLVPQYVIITMSEVMVSATAFEFAYTQAPPSMKAVAQSFELLTTCIGNIIDIFLVQIKLGDTQTAEYFILSFIMFGASIWFILLAIFYYEYVPEDAFTEQESDAETTKKTNEDNEKENEAFKSDEATHQSADL